MTEENWWRDADKGRAKYSEKMNWTGTKSETICLVNRPIKFYCENCSFSRFIEDPR
jgi:hypothetical protein